MNGMVRSLAEDKQDSPFSGGIRDRAVSDFVTSVFG
jgi:hypothetical protein